MRVAMKKLFIIIVFLTPCLADESEDKVKKKRGLLLDGSIVSDGTTVDGGPYQFGKVQRFEMSYDDGYGSPDNGNRMGYTFNRVEYGSVSTSDNLQVPVDAPFSEGITQFLPIESGSISVPIQAIELQAPPPPQPQRQSQIKPVNEIIPGETSLPLPAKATLPSVRPTSLGSGSLGVVNLGNGIFAVGSGSLGSPRPRPQQQQQQQQLLLQQQQQQNQPAQRPTIQIATVSLPPQNNQLSQGGINQNLALTQTAPNPIGLQGSIGFVLPPYQVIPSIFPLKTQANYIAQPQNINQIEPSSSQGYDTSIGLSGFGKDVPFTSFVF